MSLLLIHNSLEKGKSDLKDMSKCWHASLFQGIRMKNYSLSGIYMSSWIFELTDVSFYNQCALNVCHLHRAL